MSDETTGRNRAARHDGRVTYRHAIAILKRERKIFDMQPSSRAGADHPTEGPDCSPMAPETTLRSASHAGTTRPTVVAVVLAAGAGTRFRQDGGDGGHKLSAKLSGSGRSAAGSEGAAADRTVLEAALDHVLDASIGPVVVVTGAAPDVVPAHQREAVVIHHNPRWADGQITSLRAGIDAARALGAEAVVVGLGDQPFIDPAAWRAVAAADGPIAVATYDGRRGNPVRLTADVWELLPTTGDEGARALMRVRPELVREVPCIGSPTDIDTTEDLRRWQNS